MTRILVSIVIVISAYVGLVYGAGHDQQVLPEKYEIIGEAQIKSPSFASDIQAKRKIDALVPKLRKVGKGKVIRIEGRFSGRDKDEKIKKSLIIAKEVEQYLRVKHKLPLDLYIAAQDDIVDNKSGKSVRILVYSADFSEVAQ